MKGKNKIKVSTKEKPLETSERVPFKIDVHERYYVSFGKNEVSPCEVLQELHTDENPKTILVEIFLGPDTTKNYIKVDEIGRTPEEAVRNTVTF